MSSRTARAAALVWVLLLVSCQSPRSVERPTEEEDAAPTAQSGDPRGDPRGERRPVPMPDLVGMPSAEAGRRIGRIEAAHRLGLSSDWRSTPVRDCDTRPDTVVHQRPEPGTPLTRRTVVHVRTATLDLDRFRGPCRPRPGIVGPSSGADVALAGRFYRFAADPHRGAPFVDGGVWVGIEDGLAAISVQPEQRADLSAWELHTGYAEAMGPFSPLDVLAGSGGHYDVRPGVAPGCPRGNAETPAGFDGYRAISLTAPPDVTSACMQWWGVTLFVNHEDEIAGVALRLGSP